MRFLLDDVDDNSIVVPSEYWTTAVQYGFAQQHSTLGGVFA